MYWNKHTLWSHKLPLYAYLANSDDDIEPHPEISVEQDEYQF